jgi:cytidylate kinase
MLKKIIIAIDGHASCGKSTFAKAIAHMLHYKYIDSGAMYRAVTFFSLEQGLIHDNKVDSEKLVALLPKLIIELKYDEQNDTYFTLLNGRNIESEIRGIDVSSNVSEISKIREVRQRLIVLQREIGKDKGIVMDGRDIGTVVFPDAELKIFLTASPEIRATRRYNEMIAKGDNVEYNDILKNVLMRDHMDATRSESPLIKAEDAKVLDNSYLSVEDQLEWFNNIIQELHLN